MNQKDAKMDDILDFLQYWICTLELLPLYFSCNASILFTGSTIGESSVSPSLPLIAKRRCLGNWLGIQWLLLTIPFLQSTPILRLWKENRSYWSIKRFHRLRDSLCFEISASKTKEEKIVSAVEVMIVQTYLTCGCQRPPSAASAILMPWKGK